MLGFLIGTACLIGLVRTIRGRRYGWYGYGGCGHHGHFGRRGGFGPRAWLRFAFERLDTTPGQEKAIVAALEELRGLRGELREELTQARQDIARAVRGDVVDEASLDAAFARHDAVSAKVRESVTAALRKVHDALDSKQREVVADVIEKGFMGGRHGCHSGGGPYRSAWA